MHHEDVTKRVVKGAVALGLRQIVVHGANVLGAILLARILAPAEYGIYAIITFVISFLGVFGGTGLAASLIREWPEPSAGVYRTVYSFQQIFVVALATLLWLVSPRVASLYHLTSQDAWIFRLAALSLVATTWMVPSQIELERQLNFKKLAVIEIVQSFGFNVIAVGLAWRGWGAISFGIALFARALSGAVLANIMQPVRQGWSLDWNLAKPHLQYGFFYQSSQIVSILKDSITPVLIGFMVGTAGVGYVSWASMIASYPAVALMVLQRLYLPAFGQLQGNLAQFGAFVEQTIWATNSVAAPLAVILLVLVHPVTTIVFAAKWNVAIPLFYFFWMANLFVPTAAPVQSILNSIGKAHLATMFAVMWMILTWGLGWPLAIWKGILGIAIATALVQTSNLVLFWTAQKYVRFRILRNIYLPWLLALATGLPLYWANRFMPARNVWSLSAMGLAALLFYGGLLSITHRQRFSKLLAMGFKA